MRVEAFLVSGKLMASLQRREHKVGPWGLYKEALEHRELAVKASDCAWGGHCPGEDIESLSEEVMSQNGASRQEENGFQSRETERSKT